VITQICKAFDPPIDASGLGWGFVPRWSPGRGRPFSGCYIMIRLDRIMISPLYFLYLSIISGQTLGVCPEVRSVPALR
jgi:hypothetical protein